MNATNTPNPLGNRVLARAQAQEVGSVRIHDLTNKGPMSDIDPPAIRDL